MSLLAAGLFAPLARPAHLKSPPDCTRSAFHAQAKAVYGNTSRVTLAERREVRRLVHCQRSVKSKRIVRRHLARYKRHHTIRRQWAYYRTHPMPACTWVGESGGSYTARNPRSTAGGKYQMLDTTFHAFGGPDYPNRSHDAALAPPLLQETIARRVLAGQGINAWVRC